MSKRWQKRKVKKIVDPAVVNFLLEHLKPSKVDFSKIKFPTYFKWNK